MLEQAGAARTRRAPPSPLARRTWGAARRVPGDARTVGPPRGLALHLLALLCLAGPCRPWPCRARSRRRGRCLPLLIVCGPLSTPGRRASWRAPCAGFRTRSGSRSCGGRPSSICSDISARLPSSRMRMTRATPPISWPCPRRGAARTGTLSPGASPLAARQQHALRHSGRRCGRAGRRPAAGAARASTGWGRVHADELAALDHLGVALDVEAHQRSAARTSPRRASGSRPAPRCYSNSDGSSCSSSRLSSMSASTTSTTSSPRLQRRAPAAPLVRRRPLPRAPHRVGRHVANAAPYRGGDPWQQRPVDLVSDHWRKRRRHVDSGVELRLSGRPVCTSYSSATTPSWSASSTCVATST